MITAHNKELTVKECAARAEVDPYTIRRWMNAGMFKWRWKNRRSRLADEKDFTRYLDTLRNPVIHSTA